MYEYLNLLKKCRDKGVRQKNRTGVDTFMIPGGMMEFDLSHEFAIVTTKQMAFTPIKGELLGFIRGYTSAADFRKLGCKIWDANANLNGVDRQGNPVQNAWLRNPHRKGEDDLGRIYGAQWRDWSADGSDGPHRIDQLAKALQTIQKDPTSRRIIVNAWQPAELDRMALPPCHILHQYIVEQETRVLHMNMYMRSCDMFLGVPFNISSYALLLCLMAKATGYEPGMLVMHLADVHIYEDHMDQVNLQLERWPRHKPLLQIAGSPEENCVEPMRWLEHLMPNDITLTEYDSHPAIKAKMAV